MFLKRLDVVGFKSFAERIGIEFVPGVTAVVGPNGSGKSNISDAVRWVLGEQSAKSLRGAKMEDIIFAGSDTRKSLNVAEVTLTLDNEDQHIPIEYNEISITRRVYRSGESEYLINKQQCRLKDIIDLFMDSGLGKEAYSIIGQGKVEEILSSKPEDRRKIFEEAAGVLKYKTRKIKAEQKLRETEENLNRVEDILHELEGQVEPLKIQASVARDYLDKKSELEVIESALLVYEIEDLHTRWEAKSKEIEQLRVEEIKLKDQVQHKEQEIGVIRDELAALDESIDELQDVLLNVSEELEKHEGKREVMRERKKNYHQNKEQLTLKIAQQKGKKKSIEETLQIERNQLEQYQGKLKSLQNKLKGHEQQLELVDKNIEEELEQLKSEYFDCLNEQTSIKNEIRYLTEQLEQQTSKSSRLHERHRQYMEERDRIAIQKEDLTEKLKDVQTELEIQVDAFMKLKTEIEKDEKTLSDKESKLYKAYQFIQQFRSKKEMIEEMQEDYSGFFQGVREILKERGKRLSGIEGAVAELITVSKKEETAIETALGAATQSIVVHTEEDARTAIGFLKKKRLGRATFLPMSVMKSRKLPRREEGSVSNHPSYIGIASDLAAYEDKHRKVIENLLGNVVIAENLEGANALAKILNHRYRIVTLDGDIVNPGGSMSGGSLKQKNTSLLSRQRELDSISEKLSTMEEQTNQLEKDVKQGKQSLIGQKEKLEILREDGESKRLEEQQLKGELREIELQDKNINEHLSLYDREKGTYDSEKETMEERVASLKSSLEESETMASELEKEVERLSSQKKNQQTTKDDLKEEITSLKVSLAQSEEQFSNSNSTVQRMQNELDETMKIMNEAEEEFWLLEEAVNTSSSDEEALDRKIIQHRKDKDATVQLIGDRRKERSLRQERVEDQELKLKELKRLHHQMSDGIHQEELRLNRMDVELENRLNHLNEEYQLSYERAKEKYSLEMETDEARTKVKLIKRAIDELGTVNLGAIEEYERVSERYNFLVEQRDDLNAAKATLYGIINEMDEEMTKRFKKSFFEIKDHFREIFRELFGGGRADLELTDPDDLLNTGVNILAQPPGKKLQHLALLSGGERALTAIALLFGILKVRPVPFCILDEVEAALDEANVSRFARFLRAFSKQTQFIVVTHRKGTMEEADVLYGVTMQESGVSNLVSVKLEETKELVTT
ncbi:chromosome segregation protein SMC [Pseudalkalibacillus salsuginis]|uniref:chromosome segregation protein SMC n=1 Tax=Pseudalkalibacillus salsuginis TaxID=2910972 RepID=UPI001F40A6AB|nr:chromosome segregation protein SMC [Pseudalkalibacillus salsuginis]MCF6410537.1 chromosome segregation protein SMC [Pseudalkalibacillus salsuginis]